MRVPHPYRETRVDHPHRLRVEQEHKRNENHPMLTHISVRGPRAQSPGINVDIPRSLVITSLSGSGKQPRLRHHLCRGPARPRPIAVAYARQFLEMMQKPDVSTRRPVASHLDREDDLAQPRSTVATVTNLRLHASGRGSARPYSPAATACVEARRGQQMVDRVSPCRRAHAIPARPGRARPPGEYHRELTVAEAGFTASASTAHSMRSKKPRPRQEVKHDIEVLVDRIVVREGIEAG
jgi:excinuclease ABC subunit A